MRRRSCPTAGARYLSKFYDDDWMDEHGLLDRPGPADVAQVLRAKVTEEPGIPSMVAIASGRPLADAVGLLQRYGISQLPVVREEGDGQPALSDILGSIQERQLLERLVREGGGALQLTVGDVMEAPLATIAADRRVDEIFGDLQAQPAVVVADGDRGLGVLDARRPARVPGPPELTPAVREVSLAAARREIVAAQGFRTRRRTASLRDVIAVVERLGCVQIDAVSTVDRAQRLTLGACAPASCPSACTTACSPAGGCSSTGRTRPR